MSDGVQDMGNQHARWVRPQGIRPERRHFVAGGSGRCRRSKQEVVRALNIPKDEIQIFSGGESGAGPVGTAHRLGRG